MVNWLLKMFRKQPRVGSVNCPKFLNCGHAAVTTLKFKCEHTTCYPCYEKAGFKCGKCYGDALSN